MNWRVPHRHDAHQIPQIRLPRWFMLAIAVAAGLFKSGCVATGPLDWVNNGFKVGPNYCRPPAPVAEEWIEAKDPNVQNRHLQDWWNVFQDPTLNSLIDTAYDQNLNLRVAGDARPAGPGAAGDRGRQHLPPDPASDGPVQPGRPQPQHVQ